jgi:hypothetical protein
MIQYLKTLLLLTLVFCGTTLNSQELNCTVQVIAPTIANVEASIFESLEDGVREFMNGRGGLMIISLSRRG